MPAITSLKGWEIITHQFSGCEPDVVSFFVSNRCSGGETDFSFFLMVITVKLTPLVLMQVRAVCFPSFPIGQRKKFSVSEILELDSRGYVGKRILQDAVIAK